MAQIYENRQAEIKALKRQIEQLKSQYAEAWKLCEEGGELLKKCQLVSKTWQQIAERAVYELNKTAAWTHLTHEDIITVLMQMENLEAPNA
jgi:hypothetical protein